MELLRSGKEIREERLDRINCLERDERLYEAPQLMCELGQLYYAENRVQEALDMFYKVLNMDTDNSVAKSYVRIIRGVLDFVNKDLMNP